MRVELISHYGDDLMVVNCARVSNGKWHDEFIPHGESLPKGQTGDDRLITYLAKHGHKSPFYQPKITFRVHVPFFVRNQLLRHTIGFDLNEISRRYVDDAPEYYYPTEWRGRPSGSIKQGSSNQVIEKMTMTSVVDCWESDPLDAYQCFIQQVDTFYKDLLVAGVAPEMARLVLPQSAYTTFIWTGSLYGFANLCWQRQDAHAQSEIQQVANMIDAAIRPIFPVSWEVLLKYKMVVQKDV